MGNPPATLVEWFSVSHAAMELVDIVGDLIEDYDTEGNPPRNEGRPEIEVSP